MRRSTVIGFLLLAMGAFAFAAEIPINPEYKAAKLGPGHGMVLLRVINTVPVGPLQRTYDVAMFGKSGEASQEYVYAEDFGWPNTAIFVSALPPGNYALQTLSAEVTRGAWGAGGKATFPGRALSFKVEPGQLTNLGTLLVVSPYTLKDEGSLTLARAPDPQLPLRLASLLPEKMRETFVQNSLGWVSASSVPELDLPALRRKRLSMALNGAVPSSTGGRWFGEHLGQVAHRSGDGNWTWEDTGVFETILHVAESNGRLYALTENSTLLEREPAGEWRPVDVPVVSALPCGAFAESDGSLTTVWETPKSIHVMRFRPTGDPRWETERVVDIGSTSNPNRTPRCFARDSEKTRVLFVMTPKFEALGKPSMKVEAFDKATRTWHSQPTGLHAPAGLLPDGSLQAITGASRWLWFSVSQDYGKTWQKRSERLIAEESFFRNMTEGFQPRVDHQEVYKIFKSSLWYTGDGGYTWKPQAAFNGGITRIIPLEGQEVLVTTAEGRLFSSKDNGKTLKLERNAADQRW